MKVRRYCVKVFHLVPLDSENIRKAVMKSVVNCAAKNQPHLSGESCHQQSLIDKPVCALLHRKRSVPLFGKACPEPVE